MKQRRRELVFLQVVFFTTMLQKEMVVSVSYTHLDVYKRQPYDHYLLQLVVWFMYL